MINDALRDVVQYGASIALQAAGDPKNGKEGKYVCAEQGGPREDNKLFKLTSRSSVGIWESWKLFRGK